MTPNSSMPASAASARTIWRADLGSPSRSTSVWRGRVRWRGLAAVIRALRIFMGRERGQCRGRRDATQPETGATARGLTRRANVLPLTLHVEEGPQFETPGAQRARAGGYGVHHAPGALQLRAPALQPDEEPCV